MTIYELIATNENLFQILKDESISISYVQYIGLFRDYQNMVKEKRKKTYIIEFLSAKYGVGESTIYRVVERFKKEVII